MKRTEALCIRIRNIINALSYTLAIAFFVCGVLSVILQVFVRTTGLFTVSWTEELARFCFIGVAFFGSVILVSDNGHLKVEFLLDLLQPSIKRYIQIFINIIAILFMGILCRLSWDTAVFNIPRLTAALRISASTVYFFLVASSALMVVQAAVNIVLILVNWNQPLEVQETAAGGDD